MKIDQTICRARRACDLPCAKCVFYEKCIKKGEFYQEETKTTTRKPQIKRPKTKNEPKNEVIIPDYITDYDKRERRNFSPKDIEILRDTTIPARIAAAMTGHHVNSIYRWRKRNNIVLPFVPYDQRYRSNAWTEMELEIVKDATLSTREVQERINRSADAIRQRRVMLGITQGGKE